MERLAQMISVRRHLWVGGLAVTLLVGVFGLWGAQARIAGALITTGVVEVGAKRQVIQHAEGGVVSEILVRDGDLVEAGDVVLRLDDTLVLMELARIDGQLGELLAQKARLEAEEDGDTVLRPSDALKRMAAADPGVAALVARQSRLLVARHEDLQRRQAQIREQIAQVEHQIAGTLAQRDALAREAELAASDLERARDLHAKGHLPLERLNTLEREAARLAGQLGAVSARVAELRATVSTLGIERVRLGPGRQEAAMRELRELALREYALQETRTAAQERLRRLDIRSPIPGIVHGSQVHALQAVVTSAAPLMQIVPQDGPTRIALRIPTTEIEHVYVGQNASLRLTGAGLRHAGEVSGTVVSVSADAFTDRNSGARFYRAEIVPDPVEVSAVAGLSLVPGMPVDVFLRTEDRTPLSYLLEPFRDHMARALRDP
jgi:HlyD family type I secretion membrane fusion protein